MNRSGYFYSFIVVLSDFPIILSLLYVDTAAWKYLQTLLQRVHVSHVVPHETFWSFINIVMRVDYYHGYVDKFAWSIKLNDFRLNLPGWASG